MSRLLRCMFYFLFIDRWDDELAEVAQIWADQCTGVMYQHHNSGLFKDYNATKNYFGYYFIFVT